MRLIRSVAARFAETIGRESRFIRALRPGYESMLNWLTGGRGIQWEINGVTYRIDPHCRHRLGERYDAPVASFLQSRVKPGAVCFDVGANVGVYVLQFAHWSHPMGHVIAFEPNPDAREMLLKHVYLNNLENRVEIIADAVGAVKGKATLYKAGADGMSRLGAPNENIGQKISTITVPVTTLDDFTEKTGLFPDWLLIDIEGFEITALEGAAKLIDKGRGRLGIIVEMHPNAWAIAGTELKTAETLFSKMGLRCNPLTGQKDPLREHGLVWLSYE
jgi:FkbM family methyltransferase